jgi:F420-non-reducing hydrogenase small subunit
LKRIATVSLMSDAGCHIALANLDEKLVELSQNVEIARCQILRDEKNIPENIDVALVEGAIRTDRDEEVLKTLRNNSRVLIALGSCACFGGTPSLCNLIGLDELVTYVYQQTATTSGGQIPSTNLPKLLEEVRPVGDLVKVDYIIPGCIPEESEILGVISAALTGESFQLPRKNVCEECQKQRKGVFSKEVHRNYENPSDSSRCLLELGYFCVGPSTRAGCGARCPSFAIPCDGCRGPVDAKWDQGVSMLDSLAALARERTEGFSLKTHSAMFHRYSYASSALARLLSNTRRGKT